MRTFTATLIVPILLSLGCSGGGGGDSTPGGNTPNSPLALACVGPNSPSSFPANTATGYTTTLLVSGSLLTAGGFDGLDQVQAFSSQLYDPMTAQWNGTGSLNIPRVEHIATVLPGTALSGGKVLVAGGWGTAGALEALDSAELYDPATELWTLTGSLNHARARHTATVLSDGKVLVVGGWGTTGPLDSAELYDPATGIWTPTTGNLGAARTQHTAVMLSDGKVLVVGGWGTAGPLDSAELYDPATKSWTATGNLTQARAQHTVTLLPNDTALITGGSGTAGVLVSTELYLYDPATATGFWTPTTGNLTHARARHTATILSDGKVFAAGGSGEGGALISAELYNPATGLWTETGSLSAPRAAHTSFLLPDKTVVVIGGLSTGFRGPLVERLTHPVTVNAVAEWDRSNDSATRGYKLYYGTSARKYGLPIDVGLNTSYVFSKLQGATKYYFSVTAYGAAGESCYSNETSMTTAP